MKTRYYTALNQHQVENPDNNLNHALLYLVMINTCEKHVSAILIK